MTAVKDLTQEDPRQKSERLGGHQWLPRMIDKARATFAGVNGSYTHPCGGDKKLLEFFDITADQFREVILSTDSDAGVVEGLQGIGVKFEGDSEFKPYEC